MKWKILAIILLSIVIFVLPNVFLFHAANPESFVKRLIVPISTVDQRIEEGEALKFSKTENSQLLSKKDFLNLNFETCFVESKLDTKGASVFWACRVGKDVFYAVDRYDLPILKFLISPERAYLHFEESSVMLNRLSLIIETKTNMVAWWLSEIGLTVFAAIIGILVFKSTFGFDEQLENGRRYRLGLRY